MAEISAVVLAEAPQIAFVDFHGETRCIDIHYEYVPEACPKLCRAPGAGRSQCRRPFHDGDEHLYVAPELIKLHPGLWFAL